MYCSDCGKQNHNQTNFCAYCGAALTTSRSAKQPKKHKKSMILIFGLLAIIILLVGLVYIVWQNGKQYGEQTAYLSSETTAEPEDITPSEEQEIYNDTTNSDLAYIQEKGVLVVGITDFAPMNYYDESGNLVGFDTDMARAFADSLGVEIEFVEINWDQKVMELYSKTIDCVWNGMTLSNDITNEMETSIPYVKNAQVVVSRKLTYDEWYKLIYISKPSDLTVAVESGSAGEAAAINNGFVNIVRVESQAAALMETASGTVDVCIVDLLVADAMTGEGTDYGYNTELDAEYYGVGFRKDSDVAALLDAFFAGAYTDGTMMDCANLYSLGAMVEAAMDN